MTKNNFLNSSFSAVSLDPETSWAAQSWNGFSASQLFGTNARFQQKQLQEKEEKLLRLYDNQQRRAFERLGRNSASPPVVAPAEKVGMPYLGGSGGSQAGRVRQLFEERRHIKAAGIDKSYPLEPINGLTKTNRPNGHNGPGSKINGHAPVNRGVSLDRYSTYTKNQSKMANTVKTNVNRSKSQVRSITARNVTESPEYTDQQTTYINNNIQTVNKISSNSYQFYEESENDNAMYLLKKQQEELENLMNNHNLNESIDDEDFPDVGLIDDDLDVTFGKLPNVGGVLPSQKISRPENIIQEAKITAPTENKKIASTRNSNNYASGNRTTATRSTAAKSEPLQSPQKTNSKAAANVRTGATSKRSSGLPPSPGSSKQSTSSSKNSSASSMSRGPASSRKTTSAQPAPSPAASARTPQVPRAGSRSTSGRLTSKPDTSNVVVRDDLSTCRFCSRRFASDRIDKHQDICGKTAQKKRKAYDPVKHRVAGTEAEIFVKKSQRTKQQHAPSLKKNDWRRKHEEFINTIRSAKQAQAWVASGGKLSDLPPPTPSSNPDYVQCPHCGRRFNESAAERHIPKCATYSFNKPKK